MREELKHIGLVDEEVNIYLLLLKKGFSKATLISKRLGVARTTIYRFLSSLSDKGLVSERFEDNVKVFGAIAPEKIPDILENRISEIEKIVPALKKLEKKKEIGVSVELYKGKEGMKIILNDVLREGKDYVVMGEAQKFFDELGEVYTVQWIRKADDIKIRGRLLLPKGQKFKVAKNEELQFIDKRLLSNTSTWIYGDRVAQFIWDEPFYVILIKSRSVASGQMKVFDFLWSNAKKY